MKKLRIFSVLLLLAAAAVFGAFRIYEKGIEDHDAPVIACQTDLISVSVSDGEEKLLEGVTASDSREGDLTSRVVVQDISEMQEDGTRQITYAVSDSRGNVGYASRKMQYTDYSRPVFQLQRPLMFPLGSPFNVCEGLTASGSLDGDLTDKIKYTLDQTISTAVEGSYTVEYRVTDSAGNTSYLQTSLEVYDPRDYQIDVELTSYLVYTPLNTPLDVGAYYAGADWTNEVALNIETDLDTSRPGCYYADFNVSDGTYSGKNRLIIVVS